MAVAIHAGVAVQLPAENLVPVVIPDSLAPIAEVTNRAVGVAKAVLAGNADRVDMLAGIADLQVDNFRCAMNPG